MITVFINQWFNCYKSYWLNLSLSIFYIMISTIFLDQSISSLLNKNYGIVIVNISLMWATFILGLTQFKKYKDKERYRNFLYFKRLVEKESIIR